MAYRPTNNIQENVIHRNTIFDAQGMVSCCTCGYCIEKTEDPSLTLTNFKAADPLINQQSIGSTIIEFSNYMIPTGSFDYVLTPYQTTDTFADGTNATNLKFADSLVYYPFLKCEGITTLRPNSVYDSYFNFNQNIWPAPIAVNGVPTKTQKPYESEFANVSITYNGEFNLGLQSNGIQQTPSPVAQYLNNVYSYSNSNIYFDNQFGSYIANTFFGFSYNNTAFDKTFYNADYLYYFGDSNAPIQSDYYRWGVGFGDYFINTAYLPKNIAFIVKDSQFEFSTKYSFGIESILNNGITPNLSRFIGQLYGYYISPVFIEGTSHIDVFDLSNFKDKYFYWLDGFGKRMDYINWISSGGSIPCNGTQLQNIAANTNYNVTNYTTEKPYPSLVDLGDYQTYLSYINTHEFSHLGFKSDAGCANNIVKLITPVYFKSFDDYSFSYTYPNYTKTNSVFGITDKFIIPDFQTWEDCLSNGYPATKTLPAKTVQLKEMNSTDNIYKGGYVLDKFQINKDGTFNGTISIVGRKDFFATGLESVWNLEKSLVYDGGQSCTYFWNRWNNNVVSTTNQFNNIPSHSVFNQTLIQENEFINATPTTYIDYYNQVETGFYTNGSFNDYSSGLPVTYYEDVCRGYIQQPNSLTTPLALPTSYVAQKTDRTKITSTTDASGKTTTTIKNVLWVGKTLLTNTYTHNSGNNRPNLAFGKVPLTYDAILKGGFESDIIVSFQSKPICSIFNIIDELKRVTQFKVNFENYQKTPQQNFAVNDYAQEIVNASPDIPESFIYNVFTPNNSNYPFNQPIPTYYKSFDNIAFGIPNTNPNEYFYIRKQIQKPTSPYNYLSHEDWELVKNIQEIPPTFAYYSASAGRVYPDFGVPDRFKSCLLINGDADVWATGNEITFGIAPTVYYSIYMEEIKDEKQTAGQSLIRIATTLQNANNGIYISDVGLETQFKNKRLTVKFLSTHKDFSKLDAPRYDNFNPNSLSTANQNADDRSISYSVTGAFTTPITEQINIRMNPAIQVPSGGHYFLPSTYPLINFGLLMNYQAYGNTSTKPIYVDPTAPLTTYLDNQFTFYDRLEVISLSPLKLKYVNMKFFYNDAVDVKQYNLQYTPPNLTLINANGYCFWGFQCDVVMEEVVDEFIQEALPASFNQILQNVEFIQTSNLMNSRMPMQMIDPEKCDHIGKVIDRKDCNCPKKWVRLCDVHGKTDWKKCMQCKDFKVSE